MPEKMQDRLLDNKEVVEICKMSRVTIWRLVKEGKFPKPKKISSKFNMWLMSDINNWMQELEYKDIDSAPN